MYVCMYVCVYIYACICVCIHINVCMYVYIYIYIYICIRSPLGDILLRPRPILERQRVVRALLEAHLKTRGPYKRSPRTRIRPTQCGSDSKACQRPDLDPLPDTAKHLRSGCPTTLRGPSFEDRVYACRCTRDVICCHWKGMPHPIYNDVKHSIDRVHRDPP